MSKSAIKALTAAQAIIAEAGVTVNLVGYIADKDVRKNWRNADALAALIINSAANAFQTENSETFADNCFDDMAEAVSRYISSNLDDWNQKSAAALNLNVSIETERLEVMVKANMNFEERVAAAYEKKQEASPKSNAETLSEKTGFPVAFCAAELEAEEGDYFAVLNRLRAIEAIEDAAHAEALVMDAEYQRAQAEEGTGTIPASVIDNHVTIQNHASHPQTLQLFWSTLNEYQKEFLLGVAHDQALEVDAGLASLRQFRLPSPTKEEIEARYFRSLTDIELAYGIESDIVPESRRSLYAAEAARREMDLGAAKKSALAELVSGGSLEQAQARFVSRLSPKQLAEALFDPSFPKHRRAAYAAELQRRKGDRVSFDDEVLGAVIGNLANDLLSEAMNSHTTKPEERPLYEKELKRRARAGEK